MASGIEYQPVLDVRELSTILAALRLWQRMLEANSADIAGEMDVATDGGTMTALHPDEVDDLITYINEGC